LLRYRVFATKPCLSEAMGDHHDTAMINSLLQKAKSGADPMRKTFFPARWGQTASMIALVAGLVLGGMSVSPVQAQDAAETVLRIGRMESQLRQLSGQVEQLQFENKRLADQLAKFQQDVEFRFQESQSSKAPPAKTSGGQRKSDAYDPNQPQTAEAAPVSAPKSGPLDITQAGRGASAAAPASVPFQVQNGASAPAVAAGVTHTGSITPQAKPTGSYDEAYGKIQQKRYAEAETAFKAFLQAHPKDAKVPDATYWLGESYLRRNMNAEAAEQFLKIYQTHSKAKVAPEGLYKLALSLKGMNQKAQACASLAEVGRRYPAADRALKTSVEQESKKLSCS
jgi:tol-pal system protein YbgF